VKKARSRTAVLPITAEIAVLANQFPATYSWDPCDRLTAATALAQGISLVTKDRKICAHAKIDSIW
jgi:PIN domain nuclease of toxin-antitoxin system